MIYQIQRKTYEQLLKQRKNQPKLKLGYLIFKGEDGKYYKTSQAGIRGAEEIAKFNKNWRAGIDNQTSLI